VDKTIRHPGESRIQPLLISNEGGSNLAVIPAKAGIHVETLHLFAGMAGRVGSHFAAMTHKGWIPAFAGMTNVWFSPNGRGVRLPEHARSHAHCRKVPIQRLRPIDGEPLRVVHAERGEGFAD
jgi:hypothetical protein